jgi:peptidoglycan/xylan/chitin deacetylase (PgdA/CDA1 family)
VARRSSPTGIDELRARFIRLVSTGLHVSGALAILRWCAKSMMPAQDQRQRATFPFIKVRRASNLQILTYHRVNDEQDSLFPATPIRVFEEQMAHVAKCYNVCALEEAVERFEKNDLPPNALVITFDDGYRDNYLHAFPVVRNLSLPMTIFLATDAIGTGRTLWHDRVFSAFRETNAPDLTGFDPSVERFRLGSLAQRILTMEKVLAILRQLGEAERNHRISVLCRCLAVEERRVDHNLMLSWDDVRLMSRDHVSFGSHTASHPILARVSAEETEAQLVRSCEAIQQHLGQHPITFAYPNGTKADFNNVTKETLKRLGFRCAVTTEFGINEPGADMLELKRGRPWEEHLPTFAFKLSWYRLMSSQAA